MRDRAELTADAGRAAIIGDAVTDHQHVRRVVPEQVTGPAEDLGVRLLDACFAGEHVLRDERVDLVVPEHRADVTRDVRQHDHREFALVQRLEGPAGVRIGQPCLGEPVPVVEQVLDPRPGQFRAAHQLKVDVAMRGRVEVAPLPERAQVFRQRDVAAVSAGLPAAVSQSPRVTGDLLVCRRDARVGQRVSQPVLRLITAKQGAREVEDHRFHESRGYLLARHVRYLAVGMVIS